MSDTTLKLGLVVSGVFAAFLVIIVISGVGGIGVLSLVLQNLVAVVVVLGLIFVGGRFVWPLVR